MLLALSSSLFAQNDALDFDGSNDYITVPYNSSHDMNTTLTIEAWVYPTDTGWNSIIMKGNYGYGLAMSGGTVGGTANNCGGAGSSSGRKLVFWDQSNCSNSIYSTDTYSLNTWQHVAVTVEDVGSTLTINFYIDGELDGPYTSNQTAISNGGSSKVLYIGDQGECFCNYHQGKIDEVRIWNDIRTLAEIRENMCQDVNGQSNLIAYYQMNDGSGSSLTDASSQSNTATLNNMDNSDWVTSGAPLGNSSVSDYSSPSSLTLASGAGDNVTVNSITGSPDGVHLYRVDSIPNVTTPPAGLSQLSQSHYFGTFLVGGTSPSYTITYDYEGHGGISNESALELAYRDDNADDTWADLDATLNTSANTLVKAGQSGGEYILASASDNSLPVELAAFIARQRGPAVHLTWITESEMENLGFILERVNDEGAWEEIASYLTHDALQGQGSTSRQTEYHYRESVPSIGAKLNYRLIDVSYKGVRTYHTLKPEDWTIDLPGEFALQGNYPNPFNPSTTIKYEIATDSQVSLVIYDVKGEIIQTLVSGRQSAGWYDISWNGQTSDGYTVSTGIYFARLVAGDHDQVIKMLYLK